MREPTSEARIYVASLSDYNAGRLHGEWIDADQDADEILAAVKAMLAKSREPFAEEWAIHDYEGFGGIRIHEWESFDTVSELAEAIEEHGQAFAAFYDYQDQADTVAECVSAFQDAFRGEWDSETAYAEQFAEDCGLEVPEWLACHVDWDSYARDLFCGELYSVDTNGGVFVFESM